MNYCGVWLFVIYFQYSEFKSSSTIMVHLLNYENLPVRMAFKLECMALEDNPSENILFTLLSSLICLNSCGSE